MNQNTNAIATRYWKPMSKRSVYEGIKTLIIRKGYPHFSFNEANCSILFESWDQFTTFDHAIGAILTPGYIKLCIYAEEVNGKSGGVAVTVSDEVQHLGYMQSRVDMEYKLATFEELLSQVHKAGATPLDYNYETFTVDFSVPDFMVFEKAFQKNRELFLSDEFYVSQWKEQSRKTFHIVFAT
jgi:hypothetical protein